ncbi:MAG: hypothetical protein HQL30_05020 [Candidatus Omnitrophica bacterium]|nr:hypothetical protein [Candidatus Omnitrophota bacterium]
MKNAFIVMQIGNAELDSVCEQAIVPALKKCGLDPKRVDKHNQGGLLKSEIVNFIESSEIIIADLTNERPNCYLEVGYAMGLDKFRHLILTAREDHNHDSPNYIKTGPKIHFDLAGYDILFWDPKKLDNFKDELEKRVKRRLATLQTPPSKEETIWDDDWINNHAVTAHANLKKSNKSGFMEIRMVIPNSGLNIPQSELLSVAEQATIHTFGWPIGVVLKNRDEYRPRPKTDGIVADIDTGDHYDYWAIRKDGAFYLLKSLFEDMRKPGHLFFNTRIVRITEALLYAVRLYTGFKVPADSRVVIGIKHGGLKDRMLVSSSFSRELSYERKSIEDEVYTEIDTTLAKIESQLPDQVEALTKPLFVLFDYFEIGRSVLDDIVNKFVEGKVT